MKIKKKKIKANKKIIEDLVNSNKEYRDKILLLEKKVESMKE